MQKILILQRRPPHGSCYAKEALDVALMASAFEQDISLVFLDDGVWQLKAKQDTQAVGLKNFSLALKALPQYGIDKIFVEAESLHQRGLCAEDLIIPVTSLSTQQLKRLLQEQDVILSF